MNDAKSATVGRPGDAAAASESKVSGWQVPPLAWRAGQARRAPLIGREVWHHQDGLFSVRAAIGGEGGLQVGDRGELHSEAERGSEHRQAEWLRFGQPGDCAQLRLQHWLVPGWIDRHVFGGETCLGRSAITLDSLSIFLHFPISIYIYLSRTSVGGEPGKDPAHRSRRRRRSRSSRGARAPGRWRLAAARRRTARGRHRAR